MPEAAIPFLAIGGGLGLGSLALVVLTATGATASMGPNALVGIRTRATRSSLEAWTRAHEAAQPLEWAALATGLVGTLALCAWALVGDVAESAVFVWLAGASAVATLVLTVTAGLRAERVARAVVADQSA